jgi:hypothetical protein
MISWLAIAEQGVYAAAQTVVKTAGSIETQTLIENYTPNNVAETCILAIYDAVGRLAAIKSVDFSVGKNDMTVVANSISGAIGDRFTGKVFVLKTKIKTLGRRLKPCFFS